MIRSRFSTHIQSMTCLCQSSVILFFGHKYLHKHSKEGEKNARFLFVFGCYLKLRQILICHQTVFLSVWFFQLPRRRCGFWPSLMQSLKSIFEKSYWQDFGKCNCHGITYVSAINRRNRSNVYCFAKSMIINYHFCHWSFVFVIREYWVGMYMSVERLQKNVNLAFKKCSRLDFFFWIYQKEVSSQKSAVSRPLLCSILKRAN